MELQLFVSDNNICLSDNTFIMSCVNMHNVIVRHANTQVR